MIGHFKRIFVRLIKKSTVSKALSSSQVVKEEFIAHISQNSNRPCCYGLYKVFHCMVHFMARIICIKNQTKSNFLESKWNCFAIFMFTLENIYMFRWHLLKKAEPVFEKMLQGQDEMAFDKIRFVELFP